MAKKKMNRREAVGQLAKMVAVAMGAGGAAAGGLRAAVRQNVRTLDPVRAEKLISIRAINPGAKSIKGLLFPRNDVFMNEFGRTPGDLTNPVVGGGCGFFFSSAGSTCEKQNCGQMGYCGENNCTNQKCGQYNGSCGHNSCGKQSKIATSASAQCGVNNDIFATPFLDGILKDPFIQGLMAELHITTSQQLSAELQRMLLTR